MEKMRKIHCPSKNQNDFLDEKPYLFLSQIKKGDVFYECERGENIKLTAVTDATRIKDGWLCKVKTNQETLNIYAASNTSYEPLFYWFPYHITTDEKKKTPYFLIK